MSFPVTFIDESQQGPSGPITAWAWDFGDGGTSTSENPTHSFTTPGQKTVTLTVTGSGTDGTAATVQTVEVANVGGLNATFTESVSSLTVTFTDTSTPGGSGPITAWAWDFGDGNTSTSQSPSHTYAGSGTYDVTLEITGTSPDGTSTVMVPVFVPVPGTIAFDGRASQMSSLVSHEVTPPTSYNIGPVTWPDESTHYFITTQSPTVWSNGCVCFTHDGSSHGVTLVSDSRYTKAYKFAIQIGDTNQWHGSTGGKVNGAGQFSQRRNVALETESWFAMAIRVDAWAGSPSDIFFCDILSFGYQTSSNDQFALSLKADGSGNLVYSVAANAGETGQNGAGTVQGNAPGTTSIRENLPLAVTFGQWEEFVVGIKWSTHGTGFIEIYHRPVPGGTPGSWTQIYNKQNIDTYLWGIVTNPDGSLYQNFARDASNWGEVIDKMGLYFGLYSQTVQTETVYETGFIICPDLATAKATFP